MNKVPVSYQWLDFEIHNPFELAVPEDCRILPAKKAVAVPGKTVATGEATGITEVTDPAAFLFEKVRAYSDFVYDMDWATTEGAIMDESYNDEKWRRELKEARELINNPNEFVLLKCFRETDHGAYRGGGFVSLKLLQRVLRLFNEPGPGHSDLNKTGFFPVPLTAEHKISSKLFLFMALRFFYVNNCLRYSHLNSKFHPSPFNCWLILLKVKENEEVSAQDIALVEEARLVKMCWDKAPFNFCRIKTDLIKWKPQGAAFVAVSWLDNMGWLQDTETQEWRTAQTIDMGPFLSGYRDPISHRVTRAILLGTLSGVGSPSVQRRLFVCEGVNMQSSSDLTGPLHLLPLAHTAPAKAEDFWVLMDPELHFMEITDRDIKAKQRANQQQEMEREKAAERIATLKKQLEFLQQELEKEREELQASLERSYRRGFRRGQASVEDQQDKCFYYGASAAHLHAIAGLLRPV